MDKETDKILRVHQDKAIAKELGHAQEDVVFQVLLFLWQTFMVVIYAFFLRYSTNSASYTASGTYNTQYYAYFRDTNIMIFFGFGYLMTFLRRCGYSALGYTFLISALVSQWGIILHGFFYTLGTSGSWPHFSIDWPTMLDGLFCAGAVMISYGAILGKVTPLQMLILGIIEPMVFFTNIYIGSIQLKAFDAGGGWIIHVFGAYFGLAATPWLTTEEARSSKHNAANYSSDLFSFAGTIFLWMMWPSFNAAVVPTGDPALRALVNTFLSLTSSTMGTFMASRLFSDHVFQMVHVQNLTLAGGVVMGVAAHLNISPAGAIGCGFLAGFCSTFAFIYLTPVLEKINVHDVCGVHNLHGMPGIMGALAGIFAAKRAVNDPSLYGTDEYAVLFPAGDSQPGRQALALGITLGLALVGGTLTGLLMKLAGKLNDIDPQDWFNDRRFWHIPSDYYHVFDPDHNIRNHPPNKVTDVEMANKV
eukprot:gnl/Hemi2/20612_TR6837_c0_g23_i1.p1 gnl/Hemi2/20612_TR6837_c0_g23~~gnl/Hemi2/20612_TR6837_c0_g23_i1.p1  ORF type:complete len:475 (-),score=147.35 gnl/Hemi2/20612_TR6837_c0_g23_i1:248-1672(-)